MTYLVIWKIPEEGLYVVPATVSRPAFDLDEVEEQGRVIARDLLLQADSYLSERTVKILQIILNRSPTLIPYGGMI